MNWLQRSWYILCDPDRLDFWPRNRDLVGAVVLGSLMGYAAMGTVFGLTYVPWSRFL